jgi:hypothetical protein
MGDDSDVYCFGTKEGHHEVFMSRGHFPPESWLYKQLFRRWTKRLPRRLKAWITIREFSREPIPIGPLDGEEYYFLNQVECAEALISLQEIGYKVPWYAIDRLLFEAEEEGEL